MDKKITKLIEQSYGKGKIYEGEKFLDSVKYSYSIHQDFIISEDTTGLTEIPNPNKRISGSITPENGIFGISRKIFHLELKDGRKFPIYLVSINPFKKVIKFIGKG